MVEFKKKVSSGELRWMHLMVRMAAISLQPLRGAGTKRDTQQMHNATTENPTKKLQVATSREMLCLSFETIENAGKVWWHFCFGSSVRLAS